MYQTLTLLLLQLEPERIHDHVFSTGARIWIRPKRIQIRTLPELDPAKPDLDPVYPDLDPAPSGAGSGSAGAQSITKKMR